MANNKRNDVVINNLKNRRQELNLTQKQVADNVKITIRSYQNYEKGVQIPSVDVAMRIATCLESTVEAIFKV